MVIPKVTAEGSSGARSHLNVIGLLYIETPAGPIELSGRGSSLTIDIQKPATFRGLWRQAWAARRLIPGLARLLEFAGLELELRVGNRRLASIGGGSVRSMPAQSLRLRGMTIHPGEFLRACFA